MGRALGEVPAVVAGEGGAVAVGVVGEGADAVLAVAIDPSKARGSEVLCR